MPDSNEDTERLISKVTWHWYGFQMFTIRFTSWSGVSTVSVASRASQDWRSAAKPACTAAGRSQWLITGRTRDLFSVWLPGGLNLASRGFSA
jgi:hypothetical protein